MSSNRIYLIVVDETEEFDSALRYACKVAKINNTHIGALYIMPNAEFQNWANLEERMKQEQRQEAEKILQSVAEKITSLSGLTPSLYVGEGNAADAILKTIEENPDISNLFLGANTKGSNPGPLVTHFMGKGISRLPIPLTIIPGHIEISGT